MSIEVRLADGTTDNFTDPDRPGDISNPGDEVSGVERYTFDIKLDESLTVLRQTFNARHNESNRWSEVTVTETQEAGVYRPGQWTSVREVD